MIVRRPLKAAAKPLTFGRAVPHHLQNAHRPCSSCMSVSHGSRSPRGSRGKPPQKPSQRCSRCSVASILICVDQSLSTTTPPSPSNGFGSQDHARYDDLVLRRFYLMAKKAASKTPMDAYVDGCRATWISTGHPTQTSKESSSRANLTPRKCLGFKTPFQALIAELGKDVSNPLLLNALRFATEIQGQRESDRSAADHRPKHGSCSSSPPAPAGGRSLVQTPPF